MGRVRIGAAVVAALAWAGPMGTATAQESTVVSSAPAAFSATRWVRVFASPLPASVDMKSSNYEPRRAVVRAGDTVTWTNSDAAGHTVTADDNSFDSNPDCGTATGTCMQKGETWDHTFDSAGEFPYYCRLHGAPGGAGMAGSVLVLP